MNEFGVAIALLNRSVSDPARLRHAGATPSRGPIVPALLVENTADAAIDALARLDLSRVLPFRLIVIDKRTVAVTSGRSIRRFKVNTPLMFTSSSLGDAAADRIRRSLFDRIMRVEPAQWQSAQTAFHRHQWPTRPELSVVMSRADAATVSRTSIDVSRQIVRLRYEPLTDRVLTREAA